MQAEGSTIFFSKPSNLRKNFLVAATALGQRKSANPVLWRLRVAGVQRRERTNWEQVSGRGSPVLYCAPALTPMISRAQVRVVQSRGGGTEAERSEFLFCAPGKFYYVGSCEPQNWEV